MSVNHGRIYNAKILGFEVKIIPTYHPASALYKPPLRSVLEEDFKNTIKPVIDEEITGKQKPRRKTLFDYMK